MAGSSTGANARLRMMREATYNTAPTADYWNIPFLPGCDPGTTQANVPNPTIGHGSDPRASLPDVFDGKSTLVVPIDARYFGLHLSALFGNPTTTDIGTPYQHVFESNGTGQPVSQAIEVAHLGLSTPKYIMNSGILYNGLSMSLKRSGFSEAKFDVLVTKEADPNNASGAGTPANLVDSSIKYFSHLTGTLKRDTVALADILSADIDFSYNLDPLEVIANNGYIGGADRGEASLSVKLKTRWRTMTLYDDSRNKGAIRLDWALVNSVNESLTFTIAKGILVRPKIVLQGPAGVDIDFEINCHGEDATKMLTATLVNDHAGTAYAAA
ncbi:MAG: phage tail tube protein [Alphaproteobacteria bacterium]